MRIQFKFFLAAALLVAVGKGPANAAVVVEETSGGKEGDFVDRARLGGPVGAGPAAIGIKGEDGASTISLVDAVERGDFNTVEDLFSKGVDVNQYNENGETLVHVACARNDEKMFLLLLAHGADVWKPAQNGKIPLEYAQLTGNVSMLAKILSVAPTTSVDQVCINAFFGKSMDLSLGVENSSVYLGWTPMHWAAAGGSLSVIESLIDSGFDVNVLSEPCHFTPLFVAVSFCQYDAIGLLLKKGALNAIGDLALTTPLHRACWIGADEAVRILLPYCDLECKDALGQTPLHTAARCGNLQVVKTLIEAGANCQIADYKNRTPSDVARTDEVIKLFADINELSE